MERVCPHVPAGVDTTLPQGTGVGEQASMLGVPPREGHCLPSNRQGFLWTLMQTRDLEVSSTKKLEALLSLLRKGQICSLGY